MEAKKIFKGKRIPSGERVETDETLPSPSGRLVVTRLARLGARPRGELREDGDDGYGTQEKSRRSKPETISLKTGWVG